jgi:proteasome lid subunit RPN8/RPN11
LAEPIAIRHWETRLRRPPAPRGASPEGPVRSVPLAATLAAPLRLPRRLRRELDAIARGGYPHEVCGLLVGRDGPGGTTIDRITEARNLAVDRLADRYVLDPDAFVAADREARAAGLDIVGVWHTHPDHPARPSPTDRDAAWPGYTYLILSVRSGEVADATAWRLDGDAFAEQPIEEAVR